MQGEARVKQAVTPGERGRGWGAGGGGDEKWSGWGHTLKAVSEVSRWIGREV